MAPFTHSNAGFDREAASGDGIESPLGRPRLLFAGVAITGVAVLGAVLGVVMQSVTGARTIALPTPIRAIQEQVPVPGYALVTPVSVGGLEPLRRSDDVVISERQRLIAQGSVSTVVEFYGKGGAAQGMFALEAIRAAHGSAADRSFHDHSLYVGGDFSWLPDATWQMYTVAGEPYTCIGGVSSGALAQVSAICEFRDGNVQGTGTGVNLSVPQVLAYTEAARREMER